MSIGISALGVPLRVTLPVMSAAKTHCSEPAKAKTVGSEIFITCECLSVSKFFAKLSPGKPPCKRSVKLFTSGACACWTTGFPLHSLVVLPIQGADSRTDFEVHERHWKSP